MKNRFFSAAAAACLLLFSASCHKDAPDAPNRVNPPEAELPGADFELFVLDHEHGYAKDSSYVFEGVWRDGHFRFGRDKLDTMQLNIHSGNGIVLQVRSDDPEFRGVNAASEARCINIIPDAADRTVYHLERVGEGRSAIRLWCGEGASRREIRFVATSREEIPLEGIRFRVNGEEGTALASTTLLPNHYTPTIYNHNGSDIAKAFKTFTGTKTQYIRNDRNAGTVKLEIIGPIPLNATNTTVLTIASDAVGLQDHYAKITDTYDKDAILDLPKYEYYDENGNLIMKSNWRFVLCWNKMYGLYEENLHCIPGFRWFQAFELERGCANDISAANQLEMLGEKQGWWEVPSDGSTAQVALLWPKYAQDDKYKLYPSDLRERYAELWPQPFRDDFIFVFYEGASPDDFKKSYSFDIKFYPREAWIHHQNKHLWLENNPPYWEP